MFPRLVLLFTIVPALEIYLLIRVGNHIGAMNTLLLIIATGVMGAHYTRSQGLQVMRRLQAELYEGQPPTEALLDGALILVGGVLLVTPGLLTDAVGLALVFPASRELIRRRVLAWLKRRTERGDIVIRHR